jgi:hypothetical protein
MGVAGGVQRGLSQLEFMRDYGTEEQCVQALFAKRWPDGFRCPRCDGGAFWRLATGGQPLFQCQHCRHEASVIAGTVMQCTKLPLRVWFLAVYLISQAKTGLSSLALKRQLGVNYRTAWLIHQKLLMAMAEVDSRQPYPPSDG